MAFLVKKNNFLDLNKTKSQKFTHQSGLELTLKSIFTPNFQKAWDAIGTSFEKESEKPLTGALIASISDDTLTRGQATAHAIAEFLIEDWNAVDENEDKLDINADNLLPTFPRIALQRSKMAKKNLSLIGFLSQPVKWRSQSQKRLILPKKSHRTLPVGKRVR